MSTLFAGNLRTGEILVRNIPVSAGSVTAAIGQAGQIQCSITLPLRDPETGVIVPFTDLIVPCKSFLGWSEDVLDSFGNVVGQKIINAGPIWSDTYYNDTGTLSVTAAGLLSYYDHRFILPALVDSDLSDTPVDKTTSYTDLSLRTIAKQLVVQAQTWTNGSLPIIFEGDIIGPNVRNYPGKELHVVGSELRNLSGVENGPDVAFRPRFVDDDARFIQWAMVTGNPELTQAGPDHVWDMTVPTPAIRGVQIVRDGSVVATDDYEVGSQDGDNPLMAKSFNSTLTDSGYPRMESTTDRSSVTIPDTLQEYADEAVFMGQAQQQTWSFDANKLSAPVVTSYDEGDYTQMVIRDNPRLADGRYRLRLMSYTLTIGSDFVSIACAPERIRV